MSCAAPRTDWAFDAPIYAVAKDDCDPNIYKNRSRDPDHFH